VLASSVTEGTWAAVEYATLPRYAKDLVSRIALPSGELPRAFQILIRARFQEHVPTEINYVTHRVLDVEQRGNLPDTTSR
jgi:hypothetical protein